MTPNELLDALKEFCEDATAELKLCVRKERSEPPERRSPTVFKMDVPKREDDTKAIPYIIIQILHGKDSQKPVVDPDSVVNIRIVAAVYNEDMGEGKLDILNVITRLRMKLLERRVLGKHFVLGEEIEWVIDPRAQPPYYFGEMLMTFEIPPIIPKAKSDLINNIERSGHYV